MNSSTTVQLRKKGQFTIPSGIREQLNIKENEILNVSVLQGKAIIIIPQKLKTTELLQQTAKIAEKRGISLDQMLSELDEIRRNS